MLLLFPAKTKSSNIWEIASRMKNGFVDESITYKSDS